MNEQIGYQLRTLNNLIRRYFESSTHKEEIDNITGNNAWIIHYLADHQDRDIFQKDIEAYFSIARSTCSRVLSLMEQKSLIRRESVSQDGRLKKIILEPRAWDVRQMMLEDKEKFEQKLTEGFSEEEKIQVLDYLDRMKHNICQAQEKEFDIT